MNEKAFLILTVTLCVKIDGTIARLNITGPGTNLTALLTKIWLKGIGEWVPNLLPDMTFNDKTRDRRPGVDAQVGRRNLKDFISVQRKYFTDAADMFLPNYQTERDHIQTSDTASSLKDVAARILSAIGLKTSVDTRRHSSHDRSLVNKQHENKMKELKYYMEHNYKSTDHFYNEVKRIKKTGVVLDPLRMLMDWLGKHETDAGPNIRYVFKCFHERRLIDRSEVDIWKNRVPNNLFIDPINDPYEYGVANN